jgi:hypothetical protein
VTLDTDSTLQTLSGERMRARKVLQPPAPGKEELPPILAFLAEAWQYFTGELHSGDRPNGAPIARHLERTFEALPEGLETIYAQSDSGFYCWEAVDGTRSAIANSSSRPARRRFCSTELKVAEGRFSRRPDADGQREFRYQPEGLASQRFIVNRDIGGFGGPMLTCAFISIILGACRR